MAVLLTGNYETDVNLLMDEIRILGDQINTLQENVSTLEGYFSGAITAETTKYVASSSGGAVTDEIKFTNGILTQS